MFLLLDTGKSDVPVAAIVTVILLLAAAAITAVIFAILFAR